MNVKETENKNVLIITPGGLPVPAVKGGAVQNLIEHIISQNDRYNKINLTIISPMDEKAKEVANKYKNTEFCWIKIPKIILIMDLCAYNLVKLCAKNVTAISFRNNFKTFYYAVKTGLFLKKNEFDKVVVENNVRNFWAFKLFGNKKKYDGKYYYHLHNVLRSTLGCKDIVKKCKKIINVSKFVSDELTKKNGVLEDLEQSKKEVLLNCIDTNVFSKKVDEKEVERLRKKLGIRESDKILLFAGRLSEEKGIKETTKAFKNIKNNNLKLVIVGADFYDMKTSSPFEDELRKLVEDVKDRVVFTGYVKYEKMPIVYHIADIVVLPSMWDEPAGLTMLEAMACGKSVISTYSGGIPEYTDEKSSILLKRENLIVDNIQKEIVKLLKDENKREVLGENAAQNGKKFNLKRYYFEFLKILEI